MSARESGSHRYVLSPEIGAVPPLVVFAPRLPGNVRSVTVDGSPADLDVREEEGDASTVPIQLPVDGIRTIEISTV